uniref:NAD(+) kinase n=1 Tax=Echinostoma caproni TaxID=27848 RepID=A0A183AQM9_9TREM
LAFRLGSLGFLTPFPFRNFPAHLKVAMEGSPNCLLRMRLCCQILRDNNSAPSSRNHTPSDESSDGSKSRGSSPDTEYHFLNELVIDRGLSPFPCDLMVKVNGRKVTHFEGDGLMVSTPTGSTAYSMATGASLLHPWVPAFLLTPINSLALSSRAIVLPINLRLEIAIAPGARCRAVHFSFDGRSRASNLIHEGDSILVTNSPYPMPCLCGSDQVRT